MGPTKQILGMHIVRDQTKKQVRDKGAPKVQHVGCETGWVDTTDQLQAVEKAKPEDKGGQS